MFKYLRQQNKLFYSQITKLALPIILQNLMTFSLGFVDTIMVGTLGQDELAGLSLANTPFFVAMLFVFGLQSGGAVLISQYWGKRDLNTISRITGISWYFAGIVSFIFATVIFLFPEHVMGITTNNPVLLAIAVRYARIVTYSYFVNAISTVYLGVHRSCENSQLGMYVIATTMGLNVFLNWVLIFGRFGLPAMGIEGAATATLISGCVQLGIVVVHILFFNKRLKISLKLALKPGKVILKDYIKYSTPVVLNETLWGLGTSIYPIIYGHMDASSDIIAAFSIAGNLSRIVSVAVSATGNASAVILGKEIGVGSSKDKVFATGGALISLAVLIGLASGALLITATLTLVRPVVFPLFSMTDNAQRIAIFLLSALSLVAVFQSFNMTLVVGILRGGGDVRFAFLVDVLTMYVWTIPAAAIAGLILKWDISAVYMFLMSEELIKACIGFIRFRSRKWIHNLTRDMAEL